MTSLNDYLKDVQRIIHDTKVEFINSDSLTSYVNMARREVAMRAQCIRILTPISGAVVSATVVAGGSGYTFPSVSVSTPDFPTGVLPHPAGKQAVAVPILDPSGSISSVQVSYGGSGYWQASGDITDLTGTGASVVFSTRGATQIIEGQERIDFKDVDLSPFPGVGEILNIRSVALIYSNYRFAISIYSLSTYQSRIRNYATQYKDVPSAGCQVGQGASGYFLFYPLPSQPYQVQFDALCLPLPLKTDQDAEAIPSPWTDAVKWYAAFLCYTDLQNFNYARNSFEMFEREMKTYSVAARPGRAPNPYGRW